jgi:hypothetical protein
MTYQPTTAASFTNVVRDWITRQGELLTMIRFHAAAGNKEFRLFTSVAAFESVVHALPPRTCVIVFAGKRVPIRGRVDEAFIDAATRVVPEGTEWLAVALAQTTLGKASWFHFADGSTHSELISELREELGQEFAVGPYPAWLNDSETVVSAVVPERDGSVVVGIY